jgi:hypothetical protein
MDANQVKKDPEREEMLTEIDTNMKAVMAKMDTDLEERTAETKAIQAKQKPFEAS